MVAVVVAIVTAVAGGGFFVNLFDIFERGAPSGNRNQNVPAVTQFVTAKTRILLSDLTGEWRFSKGDEMRWSQREFDDSDWGSMKVPGAWKGSGLGKYDGFAWYRRSFAIDERVGDRPVFLDLGRIDDVDEVFINGVRVGGKGQFPPDYLSAWNWNRIYRIPNGLVDESGTMS